jgi:deoxyribonuclease V
MALVRLRDLHPWRVSPAEAIAIQGRLAPQVLAEGGPQEVRYVAGADIALGEVNGRGAVVLLSYPDLRVIERHVVDEPVAFPYVPGLLAFREVPVLARAFEKLERAPDLLLVDGQGLAHPRRFGIACHLGLLLDVPTIGVAKSRLVGRHDEPLPEAGARTELRDGPDLIGLVLRTRDRVSPVYVSVGHRIGLQEAAGWVLRLCRGYRLPEPTRLADQLSKGREPQPAPSQPSGEQKSLF